MQKAIIIVSIILGNVFAISAQGIKIGDVDSAPHPSALLEVESDDKGVLLPRMSETDKNNIAVYSAKLIG